MYAPFIILFFVIDIVRYQVQKEAIQSAYQHRTEVFSTSCNIYTGNHKSHIKPKGLPMVRIMVKSIKYFPETKFTSVTTNLSFIQLKIGNCLLQTKTQNPNPYGLNWENLKLNGIVPVNDIQLLNLCAEVLDKNPAEPKQAFVGIGITSIDKALGNNTAREMSFEVNVYNNLNEKALVGTLIMILSLDIDRGLSQLVADVKNFETFEINLKKSEVINIKMDLDAISNPALNVMSDADESKEQSDEIKEQYDEVIYGNVDQNSSLIANTDISQPTMKSSKEALNDCSNSVNDEKYNSIRTLVSDLRGDGVDFIKLLTADVSVNDLNRIGTDISKQITQVSFHF